MADASDTREAKRSPEPGGPLDGTLSPPFGMEFVEGI